MTLRLESFNFVGKTGFEPATLPIHRIGMRCRLHTTSFVNIYQIHIKEKATSDEVAFVGKTGFEPATPWSQTRCATGLRYFPILIGTANIKASDLFSA
jgi:hypothetical protein